MPFLFLFLASLYFDKRLECSENRGASAILGMKHKRDERLPVPVAGAPPEPAWLA